MSFANSRFCLVLGVAVLWLVVSACNGSSQAGDSGVSAGTAAETSPPAMRALSTPLAEGPSTFTPHCGSDPCPCQASPKPVERDGLLAECTLEAPARIQGVPCRAKTSLTKFHGDGRLGACVTDAAVEVQGFPVAEGSAMHFYPHGGVHEIWELSQAVSVDGIPCGGRLKFAWKGGFLSCALAESWSSSGIDLPAGDWIKTVKGTLYRWEMSRPAAIGDVRCRSNAFFHPDGALLRCELAGDQTVAEVELTSGTPVCFSADGTSIDCEEVTVNWGA